MTNIFATFRVRILAAIVPLSILCMPSSAEIITERSLISFEQFVGTSDVYRSTITSNATSTQQLTSPNEDIRTSGVGNLTTGKVGSRTVTTSGNDYGFARSDIFDTLTFSTSGNAPVEISYSLNFDGSASSRGRSSSANGASFINIFDITDLTDGWLDRSNFFHFGQRTRVSSEASSVSGTGIQYWVAGQGDSGLADRSDEFIVNSDGDIFNFDLTKTGTFLADPTRTYGFHISSFAQSSGNALADFLNTGTFAFTNLNGASFSSESGNFLSDTTITTVPVPSSLLLMSSAFILMFGARRKSTFKTATA